MPLNFTLDLQRLGGTVVALVSMLAAVGTALWISMIIWTYRDMKARSRDSFAQVLAAFVVGILSVPGLLVYLILRPRETLTEQYERALEEEALLQEIEGKQACPGCGHPVREKWRLCPYCHTKLKKPCPQCGELLDLPWTICPFCEQSQHEERGHPRRANAQPAEGDFKSYTPPSPESALPDEF